MTYDVILLAYSKTDKHRKITEDCIKSLVQAKNKIKINIIVLESYDKEADFNNATTIIYQQKKFNYNESMNHGFSLSKSDYVFFCNNDLIFSDGWADACYHVFKMGYDSVSPYCKVTHPRFTKSGRFLISGYQVGFHVAGWCIGVSRKTFKKLGGFNTAVRFWYSDNLYAEQLKLKRVKHALVCNSFVNHLDIGSQTLKTLPKQERLQLTRSQKKIYDKEVRRLWNAKR